MCSSPSESKDTLLSSSVIAASARRPHHRPVGIADPAAVISWHPYGLASLELLHHYSTTVCGTFSTDVLRQEVWKGSVVRLGFEDEFLLQGILATSALHLAHIKPDWKRYLFLASYYQNEGLIKYQHILNRPTEYERPQSLFVYACLINLYAFSTRRFEQQTALDDALQTYLGCANLTLGVAALLTRRRDSILAGDLSRLMGVYPQRNTLPANSDDISILVPSTVDDCRPHLIFLSEICNTEPCISNRYIYLQLIEELKKNFHYMGASIINEDIQPLAVALLWIGNNSEEYQALLRGKESLAIVILAYYAVLLHQVDFFWCFQGWGRYLVEAVAQELDESYGELLAWPKMMVGLV